MFLIFDGGSITVLGGSSAVSFIIAGFLMIGSVIGVLMGKTGSNVQEMTAKIEQSKKMNKNLVFIMIDFKN